MTLFYFFVGAGAVLWFVDFILWINKHIEPEKSLIP